MLVVKLEPSSAKTNLELTASCGQKQRYSTTYALLVRLCRIFIKAQIRVPLDMFQILKNRLITVVGNDLQNACSELNKSLSFRFFVIIERSGETDARQVTASAEVATKH